MIEENMRKEMERLGVSEEAMVSMKRLFLKMSVPKFIEEKRKEERQALNNANLSGDNQDEGKRVPMRRVRGAKALVKYLESIDCPMSETTIYRLLRTKSIPFRRISPQVLIFDLDDIDNWLGSDYEETDQ